jgi:superfamily II DNA or RNA helicase
MKKDFVFNIDSSSNKILLIHIEDVQIDGQELKWLSRNRKIYRDALLQAIKGTEVAAIKVLIEEKKRHLQSMGRRESEETMDLSEIFIDPKRSLIVLKELAATGRLYFNRKKLVSNFFSTSDLHYCIENSEQGSKVKGKIVTPSKEYDLSECDFIFLARPHWLIHRGCLQVLKENVSSKWLLKVLENDAKWNQKEIEEFLEVVDPSHIVGQLKKTQAPDPLPVLALTDPRGVFANLRMNYSGRCIGIEDPWNQERKRDVEDIWKKDLLDSGYVEKKIGISHFYCPTDKVAETLLFLLQIGWEVRDFRGNQVKCVTKVDISLELERNQVAVKGRVKFGISEISISDIAAAVKKRDAFVQLTQGVVGLISKELLKKDIACFFEGEICTDRILIKKHQLVKMQDVLDSEISIHCDVDLKNFHESLKNIDSLPEVKVGEGFIGKLRKYQEKGVAWLTFLNQNGLHGILADDMGLGKTVQVLAFLSTLALSDPILIVMPKSLLFHWRAEIERFLPTLSIKIYHGSDRLRPDHHKKGNHAILTSYATLRRDIDLFQEMQFSCVILDEAQAIKNAQTQTAKVVTRLQADFRLSITGTPVENHIGELLSQFEFLIPGLFTDQDGLDPFAIKKKVRPFILRRKKSDVDEQLPEKIEQVVWLEMESSQRKIYDEFLASIRQGLMKKVDIEGGGKHRIEILEAILRLRQICCHPLLFQINSENAGSSAKLEALLLDLETLIEEGQKALVFSQFTSMLKLISKKVHEKGWKFTYLDGDTKNRENVVNQFQNDPETKLFLISLKAGGVGMNLTAADYVFIYDPWWNEAVENQAIDRAHRIGRHHTVIAKRYLIKDSIEDRMMQLKQSKRALAVDLLDSNQESLNGNDLEFLLQ